MISRFIRRTLGCAALWGGILHAADPRLTFQVVAPRGAVAAGEAIHVQIVALNPAGQPLVVTWPGTWKAYPAGAGADQAVAVSASESGTGAGQTLVPGTFAMRECILQLPATLRPGMAILELRTPGGEVVRTVVDVATSATASRTPSEETQRPTTSVVRAEPAAAALRRTFANRLAPHEPIYFIYGPKAPAAKFQFSFKYKVLDFTEVASPRILPTLQFAFTQRSIWDITAASSPFYDTSYMPEVIFEALAPQSPKGGGMTWLGFQTAFRHESNGRAGTVSRSLNTVYFRPAVAFGALEGWHLILFPEVFTYIGGLSDNPRLKDYRGYGQLRMAIGRNDGPSLMTTAWAGQHFEHGSVQLDLSFPIRTKLLNFETYLLVQYFNGYGESLLSYREHSETVRAGVSLVR